MSPTKASSKKTAFTGTQQKQRAHKKTMDQLARELNVIMKDRANVHEQL